MVSASIKTGRAAAFLAAAAILASAGAAYAEEESYPKIGGSATFVSDYRFRGVSFSNLDPAVQAGIDLTTKSGFFVGMWGSSIADFNGATTEVDLFAGWSGDLGPLTATVGVTGYFYPGGTDTDIVEFFGSLEGTAGPATVTVGLNWAPDQDNLGRSSRYAFASLGVAIPETPLTLKASMGHERGGLVADASPIGTTNKFDWMLGVDAAVGPLTLGVAYIGTDIPHKKLWNETSKNGFVFSVSAAF